MNIIDHGRLLFVVAQDDFKAVQNMLDTAYFSDRIFGFHIQQAAEKALKAWLASLQIEFPFSHNLGILLDRLEESGQDVNAYWEFVDMNAYAVAFRYQPCFVTEEPLNREYLIQLVGKLLAEVEARFGLL